VLADVVQEGSKSAVARGLGHRPGEAIGGELDQVGFEGVHGAPILTVEPDACGTSGAEAQALHQQSCGGGARQTRPSTPEDAGGVAVDLNEQVGDVR